MAKVIVTNTAQGIPTDTMKLFGESSDTVLASVVPTIGTNDPTLCSGSFLGLNSGRYRVVCYSGSLIVSTDHVTVGGTETTYFADELAEQSTGEVTLSDEALAQIAASVRTTALSIASQVCHADSNELSVVIASTFNHSIEDLGDLSSSAVTEILLVFKESLSDDDEDSLIKLSSVDGLQIVNGIQAGESSDGQIVITDASVGNISISIGSDATKDLIPGKHEFSLKLLHPDNDRLVATGIVHFKSGGVLEVS